MPTTTRCAHICMNARTQVHRYTFTYIHMFILRTYVCKNEGIVTIIITSVPVTALVSLCIALPVVIISCFHVCLIFHFMKLVTVTKNSNYLDIHDG